MGGFGEVSILRQQMSAIWLLDGERNTGYHFKLASNGIVCVGRIASLWMVICSKSW
jgi:hypothetical protein